MLTFPGLRLSMNGYGEEPLVSGAAWQRARSSPPPRARPAASTRAYFLTQHLPPQLVALLIALLPYVNSF